jgi:small-conductance mechanosensitive channel
MQSQLMTWKDAIIKALQNFVNDVISVVPSIIAAIVVLFIGLFIASILGHLTRKLIDLTRLDAFLHKSAGLGKLKEKGMNVSASAIVGWVVKWFFIIVTFIAVADILRWPQLTSFFEAVALYLPNVIIAILILLVGFILGNGLRDVVVKAVKASSFTDSSAGLLGTVARWAVIVFAIMATLTQLGVASDLVKILFTGFVAMLALAGGLAFGLGGRDYAAEWLNKVKKEIQH